MRRELVIASVVVVVAIWAIVAFSMIGHPIAPEGPPDQIEYDSPQTLVVHTIPLAEDRPTAVAGSPHLADLDSGQQLWPYYSARAGAFEQQSAINLVVYGPTDMVIDALVGEADWLETDVEEEGDAEVGTYGADLDAPPDAEAFGWGRAKGTERFAYAQIDDTGLWLAETEQLHDGDYYGTRYHLRLYDLPLGGDAVAIQAHYEYFDWFTLRHSVTSVERAQSKVEADLMGLLGQEHVWRQHLGNDAVYDSDGWVTFVTLGLIAVVLLGHIESLQAGFRRQRTPAALLAARKRIQVATVALFVAMIAIVLGVRFAGIGLERYSALRIKWIAAVLYPAIALGLPVTAYAIAAHIERRMDAAVAASVGLASAFLVDYIYLGITVLPIDVIVHRTGLVVALGLLAAGAAIRATSERRTNGFLLGGALLWVVLLASTLFAVV